MGTKIGKSKIDFSQGVLIESTSTFNMAIDGHGFFGVKDNNDNLMLTRNGGFFADKDNNIINASGDMLQIDYIKPLNQWETRDIIISEDGTLQEGESGEFLGRVMLYMPENMASLRPIGDNKFVLSPGEALIEFKENERLFGQIRQNFIEGSNANMSRAMIDMIVTQRAYSLNASTIQSTDELMRLINEIKR